MIICNKFQHILIRYTIPFKEGVQTIDQNGTQCRTTEENTKVEFFIINGTTETILQTWNRTVLGNHTLVVFRYFSITIQITVFDITDLRSAISYHLFRAVVYLLLALEQSFRNISGQSGIWFSCFRLPNSRIIRFVFINQLIFIICQVSLKTSPQIFREILMIIKAELHTLIIHFTDISPRFCFTITQRIRPRLTFHKYIVTFVIEIVYCYIPVVKQSHIYANIKFLRFFPHSIQICIIGNLRTSQCVIHTFSKCPLYLIQFIIRQLINI